MLQSKWSRCIINQKRSAGIFGYTRAVIGNYFEDSMIQELDIQDRKMIAKKVVVYSIFIIFFGSYYYFMYLKNIILNDETLTKISNLDLLPKLFLLAVNLIPLLILIVIARIIAKLIFGTFKNQVEIISGSIQEKAYKGFPIKYPSFVIDGRFFRVSKKVFDQCKENDNVCLRYLKNTATFIRVCSK